MTTNAKHVSATRAIAYSYAFLRGAIEIAEETGDVSHLLSIYLEGEPGVGKSSIARAIARMFGYKFVDRRANMMNPDDAAGSRMQDMDTKTTAWFPPEWMPNEDGTVDGTIDDPKSPFFGEPYKGTLILFDELASADDRVRKPLFGVFLDREINGRRLPNNCIVMAAGNEAETGTLVFEFDNATRTRFITLRVIGDFGSWEKDYAPGAGISPTTVAYLKVNGHRFIETKDALDNNRALYGNPRSWEQVSKIEQAMMKTPEHRKSEGMREALEAMIAGKVGHEVAGEYMGIFDTVANMTNLYDIMEAKTREERRKMWPKSIGQIYALTYSMMAFPTTIEGGKKMLSLAKEMTEDNKNATLPFKEMEAPLLEVIMKRLKTAGIKSQDIDKAFQAESHEATDDIFAAGPLIRLGL